MLGTDYFAQLCSPIVCERKVGCLEMISFFGNTKPRKRGGQPQDKEVWHGMVEAMEAKIVRAKLEFPISLILAIRQLHL